MRLFHVIEGHFAILRRGGVFRQAKLFYRGGYLFAAHGSGFIGLRGSGGTTVPSISWTDISLDCVADPARGLRPVDPSDALAENQDDTEIPAFLKRLAAQ